ncbi:MAG: 2-oxo acid dehydrogenase subunit E2, partial [Actinomycetota bacterium]|nr:2-oxo acid dehydrogenase subunit E2 [Actinomycetota bacterium]
MSSSSTETLIDVVMPQMGVSVSEGTVVEWRKQVGDWVAYEEPICDISTDKIDTEVPSPAAGRLAEVLVEVGATVDVGTVLARLATDAKPGEPHAAEVDAPPPPPAT